MKVVIIGGGSAGWMAATTLLQLHDPDVTVVESPTIPTIGVGESTINDFATWLNLVGIKQEEIMKDTDASYKLAIRFENFTGPGSECFYPFGKNTINIQGYKIWSRRRILTPELHKSFTDTFFANMALVRENKLLKYTENFPHTSTALHFDATKFAKWLAEKYCMPKGTKRILANVTHVETDEEVGVKYLELDNGEKITADLFIDCTGFKSLLLEGALKVPFNDCSNVIPNNMAWATHMPYVDKEKELVSYTNCLAANNGWIWNIPLWSKIGTGYVYSNKFISDEEALREFKQHIASTGRDPETLEYKNIKMRNGQHEKIWNKNVVAIGLAAGFIEPLESTGLWFTHEYLKVLLRILCRDKPVSQFEKDIFNEYCKDSFNQLVNFVSQHYALSTRRDTEYWKHVGNTSYPIDKQFVQASFESKWYSAWAGINCIAHGFEYDFLDDVDFWTHAYPKDPQFWIEKYNVDFKLLDADYERWKDEVKDAPLLIDALKEIHSST